MAFATVGKGIMGPLLIVNLVLYLLVVGLTAWALNKFINGEYHPYIGGNESTSYLLTHSLLAGVIGAGSMIIGFMHFRAWKSDSLAAASSSSLISLAITALAFGFACKQMAILGNRGRTLRTLEAILVLLTICQMFYVGLLHVGVVNETYGPSYGRSDGTADDNTAQRASTPASHVI